MQSKKERNATCLPTIPDEAMLDDDDVSSGSNIMQRSIVVLRFSIFTYLVMWCSYEINNRVDISLIGYKR